MGLYSEGFEKKGSKLMRTHLLKQPAALGAQVAVKLAAVRKTVAQTQRASCLRQPRLRRCRANHLCTRVI